MSIFIKVKDKYVKENQGSYTGWCGFHLTENIHEATIYSSPYEYLVALKTIKNGDMNNTIDITTIKSFTIVDTKTLKTKNTRVSTYLKEFKSRDLFFPKENFKLFIDKRKSNCFKEDNVSISFNEDNNLIHKIIKNKSDFNYIFKNFQHRNEDMYEKPWNRKLEHRKDWWEKRYCLYTEELMKIFLDDSIEGIEKFNIYGE